MEKVINTYQLSNSTKDFYKIKQYAKQNNVSISKFNVHGSDYTLTLQGREIDVLTVIALLSDKNSQLCLKKRMEI